MSHFLYLEHHGIKGQKWGIRRFQNPDGSYTSKGKERYGIGDRIRDRISKTYQKEFHISKKDADAEAEKTKQLLKKVAIGAGIAVGVAAGAYIANRVGRNYVDTVIKAGTKLQTISSDPNRMKSGQAFYTAYRNSDKMKYFNIGQEQDMFGNPIPGAFKKVISTNTNSNIKVAGTRNAEKTFNNLLKNNSEFKQLFEKSTSSSKAVQAKLGLPKKATLYERFNIIDLLDNNPNNSSQQKLQKIFYDELKKKGYSGVRDINDAIRSGYNTKAVIFFDKTKIGETAIRDVTSGEVAKGKAILTADVFKRQLAAESVPYIPTFAIGGTAVYRTSQMEKKYDRLQPDYY